ncbi:MAG: 4-hydroxythreonine-4-phosphate dehydrogenase PdxA [Raineya sp.]
MNPNIKKTTDDKPLIGITIGDYNGIGPEIILKALSDSRLLTFCTPIIYGSLKILNKYRKIVGQEDFFAQIIKEVEQANPKKINLINCIEDTEIAPGQITPQAGKAAFKALEACTKDLLRGALQGVVTAPINKYNIQNEHFQFIGHTEYFAENFSGSSTLMCMVSEQLRVALLTGHLPLKDVSQAISKEKLQNKLQILIQALQTDFGIQKPKIAVLGLNPHAGEEGILGTEEKEIIEPVIKDFRKKGYLVYGTFPADGFFGSKKYLSYDATLAMYHDQGLTAFKTIAFESGVNYTAGLPIVRTSPDHGTAYNIAGKNLADANSMLQAIYLACDIIRCRQTGRLALPQMI